MTDFIPALARKWCRRHSGKKRPIGQDCTCEELAAAISEALEEAEKIIEERRQWWSSNRLYSMDQAGKEIAARLAALREER